MAARKNSRSRTTKKATKRAKESPAARKKRLQRSADTRLFNQETARAYASMAGRARNPQRRREFQYLASNPAGGRARSH